MSALSLEHLEARLRPHFKPSAAAGMRRVYQIVADHTAAFFLHVEEGSLSFGLGAWAGTGVPQVTFFYPSLDLAFAILEGEADPMAAFMAGDVRSDGHLIMALQLGLLFPPKPRSSTL
jgi:Putative sterol carrier protein